MQQKFQFYNKSLKIFPKYLVNACTFDLTVLFFVTVNSTFDTASLCFFVINLSTDSSTFCI